jgi:hypothetical protein
MSFRYETLYSLLILVLSFKIINTKFMPWLWLSLDLLSNEARLESVPQSLYFD